MKSERKSQISYDINYMWNPKYDANELILERERLTDIENKPVVAHGDGERRGWTGSLGLADANYYM